MKVKASVKVIVVDWADAAAQPVRIRVAASGRSRVHLLPLPERSRAHTKQTRAVRVVKMNMI